MHKDHCSSIRVGLDQSDPTKHQRVTTSHHVENTPTMRLATRMVSRRAPSREPEKPVPAEDKEGRKDFCTKHHSTPQWVCAYRHMFLLDHTYHGR